MQCICIFSTSTHLPKTSYLWWENLMAPLTHSTQSNRYYFLLQVEWLPGWLTTNQNVYISYDLANLWDFTFLVPSTYETLPFLFPQLMRLYLSCSLNLWDFTFLVPSTYETLPFLFPQLMRLYLSCSLNLWDFTFLVPSTYETLPFLFPQLMRLYLSCSLNLEDNP